ncbi:MAG: hypothetical protein JXD22_09420 [Sedimentisphaerales bacterium]|nr:hypothetical protein [Sedimentisphaerales bacterium]
MPEFVIQQHQPPHPQHLHWDLMLRTNTVLATWQITEPPENWPKKTINCTKIFDHRLKYLTYQGPLSDNRGHVKIVAAGQYQSLQITENLWQLTLTGDNINGELILQLQNQDQWQMTFSGETK